jgi:hypothetical protein
MFWVRDMQAGDGVFFGRDLWDTATDVSSLGGRGRGREGESWDASLSFDVTFVRDRGLCVVLVGLLEPRLGGGGPSDNFASAAMHVSRSQLDFVFGSCSDLPSDKGM